MDIVLEYWYSFSRVDDSQITDVRQTTSEGHFLAQGPEFSLWDEMLFRQKKIPWAFLLPHGSPWEPKPPAPPAGIVKS